ncbi:hypothetical protein BHE74_00042751 [Ensete ventricosum]|nr:hypothetical protein BHE74_00042751 [Ensete ventricosum]
MGPIPVPTICRYAGTDCIVANRTRWGKPNHCPKQSQVGCKCKLALKLLELLRRIVIANKTSENKTSEKLTIFRERRRNWSANREKKPQGETCNCENLS